MDEQNPMPAPVVPTPAPASVSPPMPVMPPPTGGLKPASSMRWLWIALIAVVVLAGAAYGWMKLYPTSPVAEVTATPAEQAPATPAATASRGVDLPTGYMAVPEGLYHWSPEAWGGRPLHAVPDRAIERQGQPTLLIFVLLAPAFARNRSGRIVSLPEGARVVVHASIAWAPVVPLAKGPEGRPVLFAVPTALDSIDGKVRQAAPGEELFRYATGDGGHEYGMMILYDPDPRDPTRPRLISLETLRGAMHEAQGGK